MNSRPVLPPRRLDLPTEAAVRQLRTILDEARGLLRTVEPDDDMAVLEMRIEKVQQEAEELAPDFLIGNIRNGQSGG